MGCLIQRTNSRCPLFRGKTIRPIATFVVVMPCNLPQISIDWGRAWESWDNGSKWARTSVGLAVILLHEYGTREVPDYVQTAKCLDCAVSVVVYCLRLRPEQRVGATFVRLPVSYWRTAVMRSQEYQSYTPRLFQQERLQLCLPGRRHVSRADHSEPVETRPRRYRSCNE